MKIINSLLLVLSGAGFGVGLVLSCGDNSPRHSDAATCDCPASEPPITGRVIAIVGPPVTIQPGIPTAAGVSCDPGTQLLSGACQAANDTALEDITLQQSGPNPQLFGWFCAYKNNTAVAVQVKAIALCLKPSK